MVCLCRQESDTLLCVFDYLGDGGLAGAVWHIFLPAAHCFNDLRYICVFVTPPPGRVSRPSKVKLARHPHFTAQICQLTRSTLPQESSTQGGIFFSQPKQTTSPPPPAVGQWLNKPSWPTSQGERSYKVPFSSIKGNFIHMLCWRLFPLP